MSDDPFCRGRRCGHHLSVHRGVDGRCAGLFNAYDSETGEKYTVPCRCDGFGRVMAVDVATANVVARSIDARLNHGLTIVGAEAEWAASAKPATGGAPTHPDRESPDATPSRRGLSMFKDATK